MGNKLNLPTELESAQFHKYATLVRQIAQLSFVEFNDRIRECNRISKELCCLHSDDIRVSFGLRSDSVNNALWKATVEILYLKYRKQDKTVLSSRVLNLVEFMRLYDHLLNVQTNSRLEQSTVSVSSIFDRPLLPDDLTKADANAGVSGDGEADEEQPRGECCICMDRSTDVVLPCSHRFCFPCIEQWHIEHKTCPICRERLKSTKDTWVIPDETDFQVDLTLI